MNIYENKSWITLSFYLFHLISDYHEDYSVRCEMIKKCNVKKIDTKKSVLIPFKSVPKVHLVRIHFYFTNILLAVIRVKFLDQSDTLKRNVCITGRKGKVIKTFPLNRSHWRENRHTKNKWHIILARYVELDTDVELLRVIINRT